MNATLSFLLIFVPLFTLFGVILFRRFGKPKRIRAVVLDKETYVDSRYRVRDGHVLERVEYVVKFETDIGVMDLSVSPLTYDNVRKGQKGMLYYRGGTALRFIKAKK